MDPHPCVRLTLYRVFRLAVTLPFPKNSSVVRLQVSSSCPPLLSSYSRGHRGKKFRSGSATSSFRFGIHSEFTPSSGPRRGYTRSQPNTTVALVFSSLSDARLAAKSNPQLLWRNATHEPPNADSVLHKILSPSPQRICETASSLREFFQADAVAGIPGTSKWESCFPPV